jgi:Tfp pilus assembly protein PilV
MPSTDPGPDLGAAAGGGLARAIESLISRSPASRAGPPRLAPAQGGASLIEAVVASALMGIGVVAGLTAWDTASMSAQRSVRQAWASCIARAELDAVMSAPYADAYAIPSPFDRDGTLQIDVQRIRGTPGSPNEEQQVTVEARDPGGTSTVIGQAVALKARALQGNKPYDGGVTGDVMLGCPAR